MTPSAGSGMIRGRMTLLHLVILSASVKYRDLVAGIFGCSNEGTQPEPSWLDLMHKWDASQRKYRVGARTLTHALLT